MKKFIKLSLSLLFLFVIFGCSTLKKKNTVKYNDIRATFVTTQGNINVYLYPEAAPLTVANFINLAQRGYYNNTKIHRAVTNFVAQGGDPTGTGTGGPGYTIPDEFVDWLDFYQVGLLAMANSGPGTGGSQFFLTIEAADWLNGKHTIFGEYIEESDLTNIKKLEVGDIIKTIKFEENVDFFLSMHKEQVESWNATLDANFSNLKKYPIGDPSEYFNEINSYNEHISNFTNIKNIKKKEKKEWPIPKFIRSIEAKINN